MHELIYMWYIGSVGDVNGPSFHTVYDAILVRQPYGGRLQNHMFAYNFFFSKLWICFNCSSTFFCAFQHSRHGTVCTQMYTGFLLKVMFQTVNQFNHMWMLSGPLKVQLGRDHRSQTYCQDTRKCSGSLCINLTIVQTLPSPSQTCTLHIRLSDPPVQ